ncbi:MAG: hypothetical protein K6G12_02465 [Lachnospiraceae bacterium]|nr:hypothetical protein [Lachnospiraceae bacterium]
MGGNNLLNILIQTVKAKLTGFVTKFRMYTSWSFIKTRLIMRLREFFTNLLGFKPRNKDDYFTVGRWMISKRLLYALVLIIGVVSLWYISTETTLFKHFDEDGIRTYKYNSLRLRTAEGHVRINGKSGYRAFEGNVEKGYVNGQGTLYNPQGNVVYTGNFEQNKYEGEGILNYEDGSLYYQGTFHENMFEGNGTMYRVNGTKEYVGAFSQGMKNGAGTLYDAGENELYNGTFSSDNIVYSELLGKTAEEVSACYKGPKDLYITDTESVVYMNGISALYHGVIDNEALDNTEKVEEVYVLHDYFNLGTGVYDTIDDLTDALGEPVYEGYTRIVLPEAIAIDTLNKNEIVFEDIKDLEVSNTFSDVATVDSYDSDYTVYIYSYQRGDVIYSFVCTDKGGYFKFYYVSKDEDNVA